MDSLTDYAVVNTGIALFFGCVIYYFLFSYGKSSINSVAKVETKSREIKKTGEPIVKAENEKQKEIKTDRSVVKATRNHTSSLAQYNATTAVSTLSAQTYIKGLKPSLKKLAAGNIAPVTRSVKNKDIKTDGVSSLQPENPVLATKATVVQESKKPAEPFLATYNATEAIGTSVTRQHIDSLPKPVLADFNATEARTADVARKYINSLPKAPKPVLAAFNATEAHTAAVARDYINSLPKAPKPVLAAYNATTASITLEERKYINSLPKAPKPVLAAYNATAASITLKEREYISSLPKAPKPVLAAFNATEAYTAAVARDYINSLPKAPKPVLAAYNGTTAYITLKEREYINSLPKAPKPVLAAFNATEAYTTDVARKYINSLPKAPKPALAAFNATEAHTAATARHYINSLPKPPKPVIAATPDTKAPLATKTCTIVKSVPEAPEPSLVSDNVTIDSVALNEHMDSLPVVSEISPSLNDTTIETEERVAPKSVGVTDQTLTRNIDTAEPIEEDCQQSKADSDIEVEVENSSSTSTATSTGSSPTRSESNKFVTIAAANVDAAGSKNPEFENKFYDTAWDNIFDKGTENKAPLHLNNTVVSSEPLELNSRVVFKEPLKLNNTAASNANNGEKKEWTREEKIRKQIQSHMPKMRNRCDFWPGCTNKNCKFSHPVSPCRVGDKCPFGKRCSFIHPKDLVEPAKKRSNSADTPKRNSKKYPKRATSFSNSNQLKTVPLQH